MADTKIKEAMQAIRKAEKATEDARIACAEADAYVATYLNNDVRKDSLWFASADLRKSAELTHDIAVHLRIRSEEAN
jgi:hypothetical protein